MGSVDVYSHSAPIAGFGICGTSCPQFTNPLLFSLSKRDIIFCRGEGPLRYAGSCRRDWFSRPKAIWLSRLESEGSRNCRSLLLIAQRKHPCAVLTLSLPLFDYWAPE